MKIATYNVNSINARMPILLRWLEEKAPDVVCLQELKAPDDKFPLTELEKAGYGAIWHGQKSYNGVAILYKGGTPKEVGRGLPGDPEDVHSRFLEAEINGVHICCLYLPNGNPAPGPKFDYKLKWMERLADRAATLIQSEKPAILTGDFNVIPTAMDAYKAERWVDDALFRPDTRAAFEHLLAQGWVEAIRKLYPDETIYTYWDYFRNAYGRNAGIRIDHFLLDPRLAINLSGGGVDHHVRGWEKSSDHAPVWIEVSGY